MSAVLTCERSLLYRIRITRVCQTLWIPVPNSCHKEKNMCHLSVSYESSREMEAGFPRNRVWVAGPPSDHLSVEMACPTWFEWFFFLSPPHNQSFKTVASFFSLSSKPKKPMCISSYQQLPPATHFPENTSLLSSKHPHLLSPT